MLSTTETVYFGKPVVGIPVFFDQYSNMKVAESKGYAVSVPFEDISEEKMKSAIKKILTNPRFFLITFSHLSSKNKTDEKKILFQLCKNSSTNLRIFSWSNE